MTDNVVIEQSFPHQLLMTFIGVLMFGASLYCIWAPNVMIRIVGVIGAVFFGGCLYFIVKRLFRPKNILEINANGFIDNSSAISPGFVHWKDVKDIYMSSIATQEFISVTLKDFDKFLQELPPAKRIPVSANVKLSYAPIQINLNSANASYEEVLAVMQQKHSLWQLK
ncbi:hypothetical protein SDC9_69356 [bioreactor metagenome]|uniref:Uncharacterized protein n=1 Tax=bioreactor metagenome TaxID=1076179 RepID=A0A644Y307_9ZZZZ